MVPALRPRRAEAQPNQAEVVQEEELEADEVPRLRQIRVNVGRGGPASVRARRAMEEAGKRRRDHHRDQEGSGEHPHR